MVNPSIASIYQQNKMLDSVREIPGPIGKGVDRWQEAGPGLWVQDYYLGMRTTMGERDQDCWKEDLCPL